MLAVLTMISPPSTGQISPDQRVAGLTLVKRALLTLQAAGATRVLLLVGDDSPWAEQLSADPRVELPVEQRAAVGHDDLSALRTLDEPLLLARHHLVADPALYQELLAAEGEQGGVVVTTEGDPVGIARLTPSLLETSDGRLAPELWLEQDGVGRLELGERWLADAGDESGRRRARHELFESCRKSVDGIVSRHFNRHVSLFISKRIVNLPVSPNAMTGITFLFALAAAAFALRGGYAATLIAAALMQANSILDGVDGELARVRFEGSSLGQWLDTIGDDASNVLFWAALGFGARGIEGYGPWLAWAGWLTAIANGLAALQYYRQLLLVGSGDLYALQDDAPPAPTMVGTAVTVIGYVLKQDFFLMLTLLLAAAGVLHWALPVTAIGALVTLGAATVRGMALRKQLARE